MKREETKQNLKISQNQGNPGFISFLFIKTFKIEDDIPSDLERKIEFIDIIAFQDQHSESNNSSFTRKYDAAVRPQNKKANLG